VFTDKHWTVRNDDTEIDTPPDVADVHATGYGETTGLDAGNTTANHDTIDNEEITGVADQNGNIEDDYIMPNQTGNNENDDITGVSTNQTTNNNTCEFFKHTYYKCLFNIT